MTTRPTSRTLPVLPLALGIVLVLGGAVLLMLLIGFDAGGFWGGLGQGIGIGAMLVGVYLGGLWTGLRKGSAPHRPVWLPSEDGSA